MKMAIWIAALLATPVSVSAQDPCGTLPLDSASLELLHALFTSAKHSDFRAYFSLQTLSTDNRPRYLPPVQCLMKDAFSRTVAQGWGNADVGGAWRTSSTGPFRVDRSSGIIEVSNSGLQNVVGTVLATYGMDVGGLASFSVDRAPDALNRFHTVQVYARRDDRVNEGFNFYRYRVRTFGKVRWMCV